MSWFEFKAWLYPDWVPEGADGLLRMAMRSQDLGRRRRAIYLLAHVEMSDKVFMFLNCLLNEPAVADAAVDALGRNVDPRGKAVALKIAKSGGALAKVAAESVGFDARSPADLLHVAMTSESFHEVSDAIKALKAWDTPEANEALESFRQGTSRDLAYQRIDPVDASGQNFEGEPFFLYRSSRELGQR